MQVCVQIERGELELIWSVVGVEVASIVGQGAGLEVGEVRCKTEGPRGVMVEAETKDAAKGIDRFTQRCTHVVRAPLAAFHKSTTLTKTTPQSCV